MADNLNSPLLIIKNLKTVFYTNVGVINAVNNLNLELYHGEILGLIGESGSGKTATALSIMGLIPKDQGKILNGEVILNGQSLLNLPDSDLRQIRSNQIAMVFQDPMNSLNPLLSIGEQITETIKSHLKVDSISARQKTLALLEMVDINDPELRYNDYPWQFSGGMRQRVMIAIALSCNPDLLIADEPTTALDSTIQIQILDLISEFKEKFSLSTLLITHNMSIIARYCDTVAVMYAGKIIEKGSVKTIFASPKHPYTKKLIQAIPSLNTKRGEKLFSLPGEVPDLINIPSGCSFHPRCNEAIQKCSEIEPNNIEIEKSHWVKCILYENNDNNQNEL